MKVLVELREGDYGKQFELELEYHQLIGDGAGGSWSCAPGMLAESRGYFEVRGSVVSLYAIRFSLDHPDELPEVGSLSGFYQWYDLYVGKRGLASLTLYGGARRQGSWRVKSGGPKGRLTSLKAN